ncbi:hypothetical protein EYF80_010483 [Liparis tanakae]|uniref:Uncharacterized protein n=1 Tax=Liparis tanakae TaxID=230148 RepID=A0A4Z2INE7_9TELE|nr:hypothetical protein EYF80_010483 [Liparis tanakae]
MHYVLASAQSREVEEEEEREGTASASARRLSPAFVVPLSVTLWRRCVIPTPVAYRRLKRNEKKKKRDRGEENK